jgi:hypothetical protein
MKRISIALVFVFLLILSCLFFARPPETAPSYFPIQTQPGGPFVSVTYEWNDTAPIRDGKLWLSALSATETVYHPAKSYLYDLNQAKVIGEISNAFPVLANQDQTKLLCQSFDQSAPSLKSRFTDFIRRHIPRRLNPFSSNRIETFWILDFRNNSSKKIGELSQLTGSGSSWVPAPGFRFAINIPSSVTRGREFFLCDMEANTMRKISFTGFIRGWWDDHSLVARDSTSNYILFDVVSRKTTRLLAIRDVSRYLHDQGIAIEPDGRLTTFFHWNDSNYDMYITAYQNVGQRTNANLLVKVEHDSLGLKLLYRNFSYRSGGWFDASTTHYLYSGESSSPSKGGDGSVWWRDLSNNSERLLVPPDNTGQYAFARIYGNTVIYSRSNVLWRIDINSTNSSPLLSPIGN